MISMYGGAGTGKSSLAKGLALALGEQNAVRIPVDYFLCPRGAEPLASFLTHPLHYDWPLLEKCIREAPGSQMTTPDFDFENFQRRSDTGGRRFILRPVVILDAMVPFPAADRLFFLDTPTAERRRRIAERDVVWGTNVLARWQQLELTWNAVLKAQIPNPHRLNGMQTIEANIREILDTMGQLNSVSIY